MELMRIFFLLFIFSITIMEQKNKSELEQKFIDMGIGIFDHWSMDSQIRSVIIYIIVGASEQYLDKNINCKTQIKDLGPIHPPPGDAGSTRIINTFQKIKPNKLFFSTKF